MGWNGWHLDLAHDNDETIYGVELTIPEGTKLEVEETDVNDDHSDWYNTGYSLNDGESQSGAIATIDPVSDDDKSIAFTNARKMQTVTVTNTVAGYSGNVVPFTYTATVTDGGEGQDDYNENGFVEGKYYTDYANNKDNFELTSGQSQILTVPYGATLNVTQLFIVG